MDIIERLNKIDQAIINLEKDVKAILFKATRIVAVLERTQHPALAEKAKMVEKPPIVETKPEIKFNEIPEFVSAVTELKASDAPKEEKKPEPIIEVKPVEEAKPEPIIEVKPETKPIVETKLTIPETVSQELMDLLQSDRWPPAVDPSLICDITSDQDKEDRAEGILDLIIDIHLENLNFLDFGCGEGHVVNKSKGQKPKMSVGYDIKKSEKWDTWEKSPNVLYTADWSEAKSFGPYNVILMYDVIDHMISTDEELIEKLKEVKAILAPNGKVYVRTHPWCSRHGTHLYHQLNKAYVHMIFTEKEIKQMGLVQEKTRKIMHPVHDYNKLFTTAGFKVKNGPHQIKEAPEPFFSNTSLLAEKIKAHFKNSHRAELKDGSKFPSTQLENQFIDYILT